MEAVTISTGIAKLQGANGELNGYQASLDVISLLYPLECEILIIPKELFAAEVFKLSSGLLGEIMQKLSTFVPTIAIIGDFSGYTSKPLHDYIRECNRGRHIRFVQTEEDALARFGS